MRVVPSETPGALNVLDLSLEAAVNAILEDATPSDLGPVLAPFSAPTLPVDLLCDLVDRLEERGAILTMDADTLELYYSEGA